ncbi:hypothetical protein LTR73_009029 [Friedmanniomyces endolithicus]|uniref:Uncharacterized protein n=1 Tax=Friedmanniomyces endolithicus TaxID=329885 RepID=A0AAN6F322_9PEZI|nr:hypothetical protein LTR82_018060 [Friedmanniomyces endolithicus]KAK0822801.1 hypothetical protein LTR73_009029 [Friedmanniomyces endolithicus]KAK0952127.1 hypothetical protein LTS01_024962 [Friedmanniomyces endolithicus]
MPLAEWNTGEQIRDHKLASSIINGHTNGTNDVFDSVSLETLRRFCVDGTASAREHTIREKGWFDESGQDAGAAAKGTKDPAWDGRDFEMLREWFVKGMPAGQKVER